jgi:hypothetical protein
MVLHRFAIKKMIEAKTRPDGKVLDRLDRMFVAMAEIFEAMHAKRVETAGQS